MNTAPVVKGKADGGAWALWEAIASGRPEFGNPGSSQITSTTRNGSPSLRR